MYTEIIHQYPTQPTACHKQIYGHICTFQIWTVRKASPFLLFISEPYEYVHECFQQNLFSDIFHIHVHLWKHLFVRRSWSSEYQPSNPPPPWGPCVPATPRSALQVLHKAQEAACRYHHYPGSGALAWTGFYDSRVSSEQSCVNEWNAMTDLESIRPDSPAMAVDQ